MCFVYVFLGVITKFLSTLFFCRWNQAALLGFDFKIFSQNLFVEDISTVHITNEDVLNV